MARPAEFNSAPRPVLNQAPWFFRLAKYLIRNRWRGGYRLIELAERAGRLACDVRYDLGRGIQLDVPLDRRPNQWALPDLLAYERPLVDQLAQVASTLPVPVRWIDVGADIGALTALLVSRCSAVSEVWAFEPNAGSCAYLERNLARFPMRCHVQCAAVSDRSGRGRLESSPTDGSEHAMFFVPDEKGPVVVVTLDECLRSSEGSLAVKIDVEGGERAVLRGAERLWREAAAWVVAFEAHRDVATRTGTDPAELVRWLQQLRRVSAHVAECPELHIDWQRNYFEQVPPELKISNIICHGD